MLQLFQHRLVGLHLQQLLGKDICGSAHSFHTLASAARHDRQIILDKVFPDFGRNGSTAAIFLRQVGKIDEIKLAVVEGCLAGILAIRDPAGHLSTNEISSDFDQAFQRLATFSQDVCQTFSSGNLHAQFDGRALVAHLVFLEIELEVAEFDQGIGVCDNSVGHGSFLEREFGSAW